jgi:hypothetical protein
VSEKLVLDFSAVSGTDKMSVKPSYTREEMQKMFNQNQKIEFAARTTAVVNWIVDAAKCGQSEYSVNCSSACNISHSSRMTPEDLTSRLKEYFPDCDVLLYRYNNEPEKDVIKVSWG